MGTPVVRRGRKATDQARRLTAELPKEGALAPPGTPGLPRREPGMMFSGAGSSLRLFAVTVGLLLWAHVSASAQTLPTTFDTTLPAVTGSTFPVNAGSSIQTAINAAAGANPNLNHEIVVQAGSAFTGALTIPTRAAGTGWIIIRSNALSSLPAAGTRVGPANAANMPNIQGPGTGASFTPIIDIPAGARQWRRLRTGLN